MTDNATSPEAISTINNLYTSMTGGTASAAAIQGYERQLAQPGASLPDVRTATAASPDAIAAIGGMFTSVTGGVATGDTIQGYEKDLLVPGETLADVRLTIAHSAEAQAVVSGLYAQELGRAPDAGGLAGWQDHLGTDMTLAQVQAGIANSTEAARDIGAAYLGACGQAPSQDTVACARTLLTLGVPLPSVQAALVGAGQSVAAQSDARGSGAEPHGLMYHYLQNAWTNIQATGNSIGSGVSDAASSVADGVLNLVQDFMNDPAGTASEVDASLGPLGADAAASQGAIADLVAGLQSGLTLLGSTAKPSNASIEAERQALVDLIAPASSGPDLSSLGQLDVTGLPPVQPSPGGTISALQFARSGKVLSLADPADQALAANIAASGDQTGVATENLATSIIRNKDVVDLPGGKYGSNNGFDHVIQNQDRSVTLLMKSKQLPNGAASLSTSGAGGQVQMSKAWVEAVLPRLVQGSPAEEAVSSALDNGTLIKAVIGVDRIHPVRTTAQLVGLRLADGLRVHALASAATAAARASTSTTLGS